MITNKSKSDCEANDIVNRIYELNERLKPTRYIDCYITTTNIYNELAANARELNPCDSHGWAGMVFGTRLEHYATIKEAEERAAKLAALGNNISIIHV